MKPSSRAGRFKKRLVQESQLIAEAPLIEAKLAPVLKLYRQNEISSSELTAYGIILTLSTRLPTGWLGSPCPKLGIKSPHKLHAPWDIMTFGPQIQKRLEKFHSVGDIFENFALRSTPQTAHFWPGLVVTIL